MEKVEQIHKSTSMDTFATVSTANSTAAHHSFSNSSIASNEEDDTGDDDSNFRMQSNMMIPENITLSI